MSKNNGKGNKNRSHNWRCIKCGNRAETVRDPRKVRRNENGKKLRPSGSAIVIHSPKCPNFGQPNNWS